MSLDQNEVLNEVFGEDGEKFFDYGEAETDASDSGDDAGDDGDSSEGVEDGDAGSAEDGGAEAEESDSAPELQNDALGDAIRRLHELEGKLKVSEQKAAQHELEATRPRFIPFDRLPEETQEAIAAEAEKFGITPEQMTYDIFKKVEADHFAGRSLQPKGAEQSSAIEMANAEIEDVFASHPLHSKFGKDVAETLKGMGWFNNAKLAETDVNAYRRNAVKLINEAYHKLEVEASQKQRSLNAKQAAKASTRSEAAKSSSPATQRSSSPRNFADEVFDAMNNGAMSISEQLRRTAKR